MDPDIEHVDRILDNTTPDIDGRTLGVLPMDRDEVDGDVEFVGEEEDLDVDGAAVGARAREDGPRRISGEAFESALTVDDGFAEDEKVGEHQKPQADDAP